MALYRHRRKFPDQKKIRLQYQSFREILLRDNKLMEKVLRDVIATLGPTKVEDIIEDVKTTRFLTH